MRPPDKHDFSLSGMMVFWLIAIICDANIKRLLLGYLVLLWSDVSLYQIDFSLCRTDDVIKIDFQLCRNNFVSKQVCTFQIHPRLHCTYDAMHFGIDTTWRMDDGKELYSFIYNCSAIKEITLDYFLRIRTGKNF